MISRTVLIFILFTTSLSKIGDRKFFCNFPEFFDTTVKPAQTYVDLNLYSGLWYEVARAPFRGEQNCVCSEAHYTYNAENGQFVINNVCLNEDGSTSSGTIKPHTNNKFNTFLKISFILPFIGGNYFIMDIDPDYKWAVVGEPCRKNYWILSRDKNLDRSFIMEKYKILRSLGFPQEIILREDTCTKDTKEE